MTLKEPIQLEPGKTVHIRINYIGLFKRRSFVMTAIYPAATYTVLDSNILKIVILTNLIKKHLELNKNIQLETIYKCVDITYIITDIIKVFVVITTTSSVFSDPFSTV